jgi:hypothetical protein
MNEDVINLHVDLWLASAKLTSITSYTTAQQDRNFNMKSSRALRKRRQYGVIFGGAL